MARPSDPSVLFTLIRATRNIQNVWDTRIKNHFWQIRFRMINMQYNFCFINDTREKMNLRINIPALSSGFSLAITLSRYRRKRTYWTSTLSRTFLSTFTLSYFESVISIILYIKDVKNYAIFLIETEKCKVIFKTCYQKKSDYNYRYYIYTNPQK